MGIGTGRPQHSEISADKSTVSCKAGRTRNFWCRVNAAKPDASRKEVNIVCAARYALEPVLDRVASQIINGV